MFAVAKFTFLCVATVAFVAVLFYAEEGYWPWAAPGWRRVLRHRYRILTRRCVWCGCKREHHEHCLHCITSWYFNWRLCHGCSKKLNLARLYSASPAMQAALGERS